jgi:proline iminopeptidase
MLTMRTTVVLSLLLMVVPAPAAAKRHPTKVQEGYAPGADGVRLFYYRKVRNGSDVVIFLHGGPGASMHDGGYEIQPVAKGHSLIMYDQRGGGRSEIITDPARLTAEDHVRDLEALREDFKIQKFSLIGLSWGAGLAALYASEHPEHVSRVIFLAPLPPARVPFLQQRVEHTNAALTAQEVARVREIMGLYASASDQEAISLCREQFRIIEKPYRFRPSSSDSSPPDVCNVPPAAIRNFWIVNAAVFKSLGNYDLRPKLASIKVPALVIEGAKSVVPLDATIEWSRAAPNARLLLIPGAGHGVFQDQPRALLNAIEVFLAGVWPRGAVEVSHREEAAQK